MSSYQLFEVHCDDHVQRDVVLCKTINKGGNDRIKFQCLVNGLHPIHRGTYAVLNGADSAERSLAEALDEINAVRPIQKVRLSGQREHLSVSQVQHLLSLRGITARVVGAGYPPAAGMARPVEVPSWHPVPGEMLD